MSKEIQLQIRELSKIDKQIYTLIDNQNFGDCLSQVNYAVQLAYKIQEHYKSLDSDSIRYQFWCKKYRDLFDIKCAMEFSLCENLSMFKAILGNKNDI